MTWMLGPQPLEFDPSETVGILADDAGARKELLETYLGRRKVDVQVDGHPLDAKSVRNLSILTAGTGWSPSWLTRETLDENFKWIFTGRSLDYDRRRVRDALVAVAMPDWSQPPRLDERVESLRPIMSRTLALARLLFLPQRVLVFDSPLADAAGGELSLLLDTLYVVCESPGLKLIVAQRRNELPPFCDRIFSTVREADGFSFEEVAS